MKNRLLQTILASLLLVGLLAARPAVANASTSDDEAEFIELVNELRSSLGLATLAPHGELHDGAVKWTAVLANTGELSHAPDLAAGVTAVWAKLGENVGVASEGQTRQLFDAFVASPSHYANLIDPDFRYIGVSVIYDDTGRMWTTHRFMKTFDDVATPSTTAPSAPAPEQPTTLPATTSQPVETAPPETVESLAPESTTSAPPEPPAEELSQPTSGIPATTPLNTGYVVEVIDELAIAGI